MKNHHQTLLASLFGLAWILAPNSSLAVDITKNLCDPPTIWTNKDKIRVNLGSEIVQNTGLVVTSAANAFDNGTAYYIDALTLREKDQPGTERKVYNYFRMHMGPQGMYGLTAIVQNNVAGGITSVGANGGGLGFGGIPNSIVWEFDNHSDGALGDAHLSLMFGADFQMHLADANNLNQKPGDVLGENGLFSNRVVDVWIDYDHTRTPRFIVKLHAVGFVSSMDPLPDPDLSKAREMQWTVPGNGIDPAVLDMTGNNAVGDAGWFGFTSSRGNGTDANTHWISRWQFSNEGQPCGCPGDVCPQNTVCDSDLGHCVPSVIGCTTDADCPNNPVKPRCDAAMIDKSEIPYRQGVCVPCLDDTNCGHITDPTRPYCLDQSAPEVNECVACAKDEHCSSKVCNADTHECDECRTDLDCLSVDKPRCDTTVVSAICSVCIEDANCTRFSNTPYCDEGNEKCVECTIDEHCKDTAKPDCEAGVCKAKRFVAGGGCNCSLPGADGTTTAAALAALMVTAAGLSRRRRRR